MKKVLLITVLCLTLSSLGFSSGFFLKLGGGATYIMGGDYGSVVQGRNDYFKSLSGFTVSGQLDKMALAANFSAELVYDPVDYVGVGLEIGYIHATNDSQIEVDGTSDSIIDVFTPLLTAIYFAPNLHFNIPLAERVSVHVSGGPGIYQGSFKFNQGYQETSGALDEVLTFDSDSKTAVGFQGAIGVDLGLSDSIAIFIDVVGRSVKFTGVTGGYTLSGTSGGTVVGAQGTATYWYHETASGGAYYPDWTLAPTMPSGPNLRNVREAALSLGGVALMLGLKISL